MNEATGSGRQINSGFQVVDGSITVGGVPLTRLAARVGATPFFAYDRRLISERVESLRRALPAEIHLSYAIKANPMPAVVQHLAGLVDGFDVASAGELKTVLDTPMMRERVSFAGPGKRIPPALALAGSLSRYRPCRRARHLRGTHPSCTCCW